MRALFAFGVAAAFIGCSGSSSSRQLVLIHTNDEHSHVLGYGPEFDDFPPSQATGSGAIRGGAARRATVFASERARAKAAGADSLTVSAGDWTMDTLIEVANPVTAPDLRVLKLLNYDVVTLGNHEFDYGPGTLATMISAAIAAGGVPPIVSSNIHFPSTPTAGTTALRALYDPSGGDGGKAIHKSWVITTPNGLKVGFVGIIGQDAAFKAPAKSPITFSLASCCGESIAPAVMAQIFDDLKPTVAALHRDQKVDVVVLLSHSGVNTANLDASEDLQIARNVPGIDVIVSGHTHDLFPAMVVMNPVTQRPVLIQQAGAFGQYVGRIQLSVDGNKNVTFNAADQALIAVDDKIAGGNTAIDDLVTGTVAALEQGPAIKLSPTVSISFLEYTLTQAELGSLAAPLMHDPAHVGSLYFRPLGKLGFDVPGGIRYKESQGQILVADSFLWAAENMATLKKPTDVGIFAQGELREGLQMGKTGTLAFADVFRVTPLGGSPITGTPGYPLCRYGLLLAEIKGALDLTTANLAQQSPSNSDFFVLAAGMKFEFDLSRKPFDPGGNPLDPNNGRVTKISIAHDHAGGVYETYDQVIYDASHLAADGKTPDPFFGSANALKPYTAVMSLYVGLLSSVGGVKLKNPDTGAVLGSPTDGILHRDDGSEIKEWEALAGYIKSQSAANGGVVPARYNPAVSTTARRAICVGASCPQ